MNLYKKLCEYMEKKYNSNFYIDKQDYRDKEILKSLCKIIDKELKKVEFRNKEDNSPLIR